MGHSGKDMNSSRVVKAGLKCSPLGGYQNKGGHLQVHLECFKDRRKSIQSIRQHHPGLILRLNLLPVQLRDLRWASQWNDCSRLQNRGKQMSQGLWTCFHCWRFLTMIMMQMMRVTIRRTWVVQTAHHPPAWSNWILLEPICQKNGAGQLWCIQQVE